MHLIQLAQDREKRLALGNSVMTLCSSCFP